jgi:hypothetical protein
MILDKEMDNRNPRLLQAFGGGAQGGLGGSSSSYSSSSKINNI